MATDKNTVRKLFEVCIEFNNRGIERIHAGKQQFTDVDDVGNCKFSKF